MPDLIGHLVQKHSETARDTIFFRGIASSFRIKVHQMLSVTLPPSIGY